MSEGGEALEEVVEEEGLPFRVILLIKDLIHFRAVGVAFQEMALGIEFSQKLTPIPEVASGLGAHGL